MAKKSPSINLVNADNNQVTNQIVNWALTIGRIMIIIVELIALTAFIYRFILDNQLRDINSKIKLEQEVLASQQAKESLYRNLQDRLNLGSSIINQAQTQTKIYKDIIALAPPGVSFKTISYGDNKVDIQLDTGSVFPLSIFVTSLKNYSQTSTITIDLIENRTETGTLNVLLSVNLKNKGGKNETAGN